MLKVAILPGNKKNGKITKKPLNKKDPEALTIDEMEPDSWMACCNCGHVQQVQSKQTRCEICEEKEWTKAYKAKIY